MPRFFRVFVDRGVRSVCLIGDAQIASGKRRIEHDRFAGARGAAEIGEGTATGPVGVPALGQLGAVEVSRPAPSPRPRHRVTSVFALT